MVIVTVWEVELRAKLDQKRDSALEAGLCNPTKCKGAKISNSTYAYSIRGDDWPARAGCGSSASSELSM